MAQQRFDVMYTKCFCAFTSGGSWRRKEMYWYRPRPCHTSCQCCRLVAVSCPSRHKALMSLFLWLSHPLALSLSLSLPKPTPSSHYIRALRFCLESAALSLRTFVSLRGGAAAIAPLTTRSPCVRITRSFSSESSATTHLASSPVRSRMCVCACVCARVCVREGKRE